MYKINELPGSVVRYSLWIFLQYSLYSIVKFFFAKKPVEHAVQHVDRRSCLLRVVPVENYFNLMKLLLPSA